MTDPGPPVWERAALEKVALQAIQEQRRARQWSATCASASAVRRFGEAKGPPRPANQSGATTFIIPPARAPLARTLILRGQANGNPRPCL